MKAAIYARASRELKEVFAVHKELVISISDLRYVSIECPVCRARVVLDMKERSEFAQKHGIFAPKACPGCQTAYDMAIQPQIDAFQRAYETLLPIADRIRFQGEPVALAGCP
jgi:hypothetical protein